jgi:hypothetical protein
MKNRLFFIVFIFFIGCAAAPPTSGGCIKDVCSLWDKQFCELCDGYNEEKELENPNFRLCPAGRKHVKLCCDGHGCYRLDRNPKCNGIITVCQNWVGKNTFDSNGFWLREGTCYEQVLK